MTLGGLPYSLPIFRPLRFDDLNALLRQIREHASGRR